LRELVEIISLYTCKQTLIGWSWFDHVMIIQQCCLDVSAMRLRGRGCIVVT